MTLKLFFSNNWLSVISSVIILLYIVLHKTIYKNSSLFKVRSKISQILFKIFSNLKVKFTQNFLKILSSFFNLHFFEFRENFLEYLLKILINYLEIEFVMRSMERDLKSANVYFEIVKYVVDECLTNIKKKKKTKKCKNGWVRVFWN